MDVCKFIFTKSDCSTSEKLNFIPLLFWSKYSVDQSLQEVFYPVWTRFEKPCTEWSVSVSVTVKCRWASSHPAPLFSGSVSTPVQLRVTRATREDNTVLQPDIFEPESGPEEDNSQTSSGGNMAFLSKLSTLCHWLFFFFFFTLYCMFSMVLLAAVKVALYVTFK